MKTSKDKPSYVRLGNFITTKDIKFNERDKGGSMFNKYEHLVSLVVCGQIYGIMAALVL